jgi:hypothetical protein
VNYFHWGKGISEKGYIFVMEVFNYLIYLKMEVPMKKIMLILVLISLFTLKSSSQVYDGKMTSPQRPGSKHIVSQTTLTDGYILFEDLEQQWGGTQWDDTYKTTFVYDPGHVQEEAVTQEWTGTAWVNFGKYLYSYDASGNLTEDLYQSWSGSQWTDEEKWTISYNGNNFVTEEIQQVSNGASLQNVMKTTYTYGATSNREQMRVQKWAGSWQDSTLTDYTFTNNLETYWFRQVWDGTSWTNDQRANSTYNSSNLLEETYYELWMFNTFWSNMGHLNISYDANNNNVLQTMQYWDSGLGWVNQSKQTQTYTAGNMLNGQLYYFWINAVWENYSRTTYTYDANENLTEYLWELWDNSAYVNDMRELFTYQDITSLDEKPGNSGEEVVSANFPNPFHASTTIQYTIDSKQPVVLTVLDAAGRTIKTLVNQVQEAGTHQAVFSLDGLTQPNATCARAGIYFYELTVGSLTFSRKMISIK